MRSLKFLSVALAFGALPLTATAQQPTVLSEVVDKIVAQERAEVQLLRQYSPLVETYIQYLRPDKQLGAVPDGDKYFLGRAELAKGVELEPLNREAGMKQKLAALPNGRVWRIEFDRGEKFGPAAYSLAPGTYEFTPTDLGWQLYREVQARRMPA